MRKEILSFSSWQIDMSLTIPLPPDVTILPAISLRRGPIHQHDK